MKKIILFILLLTISIFSYGQNIKNDTIYSDTTIETANTLYPKVIKDSTGKKFVLFTLEQAIKIDNKLELLDLLEKNNIMINQYDSICIQVINEKDIVIAQQDVQIGLLNDLIDNKNLEIDNLKKQITLHLLKEANYVHELNNKNKEIELHLKKIKKLEKTVLWGGISSAVVIITTFFIFNK